MEQSERNLVKQASIEYARKIFCVETMMQRFHRIAGRIEPCRPRLSIGIKQSLIAHIVRLKSFKDS